MLPLQPDFATLDLASPGTADRRTLILAHIGNLVFAWSNNETLLIYLIGILMRTNEVAAAIVFATLNTSRARIDLVSRLARSLPEEADVITQLLTILERFSDCSQVRNEFNHCMYDVDATGEITHTRSMRITVVRGRPKLGLRRALDAKRLDEIAQTTKQLQIINRQIWALLPALRSLMDRPDPAAAT